MRIEGVGTGILESCRKGVQMQVLTDSLLVAIMPGESVERQLHDMNSRGISYMLIQTSSKFCLGEIWTAN